MNRNTMITLKELLLSQDMGELGAQRIVNNANFFDANEDPISAIIVNAYSKNQKDEKAILTDISYAIDQLGKVKKFIQETIKSEDQ